MTHPATPGRFVPAETVTLDGVGFRLTPTARPCCVVIYRDDDIGALVVESAIVPRAKADAETWFDFPAPVTFEAGRAYLVVLLERAK